MSQHDQVIWQMLMKRAYHRWQENKEWDYDRMLRECPGRERAAVLLGNFNYQVNNGGFCQWVDNGYALKGKEVVAFLTDLAKDMECPIATKLAGKVDELLKHVNLNKKNPGCMGNYWVEDFEEDILHEGATFAQSLDNWYYQEVEPTLVPTIEKWLNRP